MITTPVFPAPPHAESFDSLRTQPIVQESGALAAIARGRKLMQLVRMRWIAILGQILTVGIVHWVLGIRLPLGPMVSLLLVLCAVNIFNAARARGKAGIPDWEIFLSVLVDVAVLTGQLYLSGGGANPFLHIYLLQVVVGIALLNVQYGWLLSGLTSLCMAALHWWYRPLELEGAGVLDYGVLYAAGLVICYVINAVLLVSFGAKIVRINRLRDESLAALHQQASEEEHIKRMGLLASGAAHELSTPLATLSVILGDWQRLPAITGDPELQEDLQSMQQQLERCKRVLSGILISAGNVRAESVERTTLQRFLSDVLAQWQATRPAGVLRVEVSDLPEFTMVADTVLRQMLHNVLDNALEARPGGTIDVSACIDKDELVLQVQDEGPGFAPEILRNLGRPYQSTKGRTGGGLGLFLSVNVARAFGGRIQARNLAQHGAQVLISLPLQSVRAT